VRIDDPRLEASQKAMFERIEKYNAIVLAVTKGHLAIEDAMDEFIEATAANPQYIVDETRFMFALKAHICLSPCAEHHIDNIWSVLWAMNALRNKVAHTQELEKIQGQMDNLRKVLNNIFSAPQVKSLEKQPDHYIVVHASSLCAGFLATIAGEAKAKRRKAD
jgi:hypothetical protein